MYNSPITLKFIFIKKKKFAKTVGFCSAGIMLLQFLLLVQVSQIHLIFHLSTGPPTITTHPTSQLTTVGMGVTLNCEGTGRGSITYQWQNRNINRGRWRDISNNRRLVVRTLEQSQQYRCVVSNEAGGTTSNVATVYVLSEPQPITCMCSTCFFYRNHHSPIK